MSDLDFPWEREILSNKAVIRCGNNNFRWRFDGDDLKTFKNAQKNDVIRSAYFPVNKCVFYLECTPNSWGKSQDCNVWCALAVLPSGVSKAKVYFKYECEEVKYEGDRIQILNKKGGGIHSTTAATASKFKSYQNLTSFIYKCRIEVCKYFDKDGELVSVKNLLQQDDIIHDFIAKNLSLQRALNTANANNTQLHSQVNQLNSKLAEYELKEKNGQIYVRNSIFLYNAKDKELIKPRDDIAKHQQRINEIVINHNKTMRKWLIFSQTMNNEYKQCKDTLDEEKTDGGTPVLLSSYIQCKNLWQQQKCRMESVTDILFQLIQQKKQLKSSVSEHNEKVKIKCSEYQKESKQYEESVENRNIFEDNLQKTLTKLNDEIETENKTNKHQCELFDEYNTLETELVKYKSITKDCKKLIKKYNEFDSMNEETIEQMEKYFDNKWIESMKLWYKWDSNSVVCWIKYLQETKQLVLSHCVDLDTILETMKLNEIVGNSLLTIDKVKLEEIGFESVNDRNELYDKTRKLISKYPHPGTIEIPKEYLCPYSNKIMKNPVLTFDGFTYEKTEIEPYLKKEKKSPMTEEECDEDDMWFTSNKKLKQKIAAFLSVNPQFC